MAGGHHSFESGNILKSRRWPNSPQCCGSLIFIKNFNWLKKEAFWSENILQGACPSIPPTRSMPFCTPTRSMPFITPNKEHALHYPQQGTYPSLPPTRSMPFLTIPYPTRSMPSLTPTTILWHVVLRLWPLLHALADTLALEGRNATSLEPIWSSHVKCILCSN